MAILEAQLYETTIPLNLLVEFSVSEEVAVARNRARDKSFKETDSEIIQRLHNNKDLVFRTDVHHVFENNADVETAVQHLFLEIWDTIR
jgi:ribose 1,5-bisphosphokinase PhnN